MDHVFSRTPRQDLGREGEIMGIKEIACSEKKGGKSLRKAIHL